MHELAMEGTFTKVLLHLRNADGEFLSKFTGNHQFKFFNFFPSNYNHLPSVCLKVLDTINEKFIYYTMVGIKLKI